MIIKYGLQFQYMTVTLEQLADAMQDTLPLLLRNKKTQTPKRPRFLALSTRRTHRS
jgi:hypothetical protein